MTILSYLTCRSKVMLLLASAFLATGASGAQPGAAGYNFSYSTKGDRSVWPTQVFDNGTETYFQFNPDRTIPAIFALTPCGNRVLITPRSQGPYLVVPGLYKNYSLQLGARSSTVDYAGTQEIPLEESIANEANCAKTSPATGVASGAREYGAVMPTLGDPAASPRPAGITQARSVVESAKGRGR
ncbi:TrbG/VirB9 family P-type conjugative transfer protein [Undibacterium arcticum]|uniref:TrbG/VirB9 family P-type conjugative transfer protein n=1 Tax=Undibacterium arcticum TaxID=1762892 RepID=UPI0036225A04